MEKIDESIYKALRDDSTASVGIRALLGNTATSPYNVYHAFLPDDVDFQTASGQVGFLVYHRISSVPDIEQHNPSGLTMVMLYQISAYARSLPTVESVLRRVRWRLDHLRGVTLPTTLAALHQIKLDSAGPTRFDDAFKVFFRNDMYRVWGRDDNLN